MRRLRAVVFERTGIAIEDDDPIMAVLVASTQQTEEIGARLLARTNPVRIAVATGAVAVLFAAIGATAGWHVGRSDLLQAQANPKLAQLVVSKEGQSGLRLAELGVASLLAKCSGRRSWRVRDGYCIPALPDGRADGFRVNASE